jgi:hypothetical protein
MLRVRWVVFGGERKTRDPPLFIFRNLVTSIEGGRLSIWGLPGFEQAIWGNLAIWDGNLGHPGLEGGQSGTPRFGDQIKNTPVLGQVKDTPTLRLIKSGIRDQIRDTLVLIERTQKNRQ